MCVVVLGMGLKERLTSAEGSRKVVADTTMGHLWK